MKLNNITQTFAGHPFRGSVPEIKNSGIRVIQMKNISSHLTINWASTVESEPVSSGEPNWLMHGDILLAGRGNHNYAVLVDDFVGKALASPHFYVIRIESENIWPEFLAWQLNQAPIQRYFDNEAEGTLTKSIRRKVVEDTEIVIPPLETQEQIINLQTVIHRKKQIYESLLRNQESLMAGIAARLLSNTDQGIKN